jgi:hypothetical protein
METTGERSSDVTKGRKEEESRPLFLSLCARETVDAEEVEDDFYILEARCHLSRKRERERVSAHIRRATGLLERLAKPFAVIGEISAPRLAAGNESRRIISEAIAIRPLDFRHVAPPIKRATSALSLEWRRDATMTTHRRPRATDSPAQRAQTI